MLGATKMDRPEWIDVDKQGWVYATLTNNSNRGANNMPAVDAANPRANNTQGNIIRWLPMCKPVKCAAFWSAPQALKLRV